jgi:AraC family transcriptional regulator
MSGYGKGIDTAWRKLMKFAYSRNIVSDKTQFIGISHDNPVITSEDRCRYYACISVPSDVSAAGEVGIMDLSPASYAVYRFEGAAADIPGVYRALYRDWFPDSGCIPDDKPPIEIYPPDMYTLCPEDGFCYDIAIPVKELY